MDNLLNLGKQAYSQYQASQQPSGNQQNFGGQGNNQQQGDFGVGGGAHLNQPSGGNNNQGIDLQSAASHAQNEKSEDSGLFDQALSFLQNSNNNNGHVDEQAVQNAHNNAYNNGQASQMDSSSLGAAAAMQALKSFTSGSSGGNTQGSGFQSQLIGKAMAEAAKLFDQSGASSGTKQDVINSASQTVMKLLIKNQVSGLIGGGGSGGLGSLVSALT